MQHILFTRVVLEAMLNCKRMRADYCNVYRLLPSSQGNTIISRAYQAKPRDVKLVRRSPVILEMVLIPTGSCDISRRSLQMAWWAWFAHELVVQVISPRPLRNIGLARTTAEGWRGICGIKRSAEDVIGGGSSIIEEAASEKAGRTDSALS